MNNLPFGTIIKILGKGGPHGHKLWIVRDRYGWGTELDFYVGEDCWYAEHVWGRRDVRYQIVKMGDGRRY